MTQAQAQLASARSEAQTAQRAAVGGAGEPPGGPAAGQRSRHRSQAQLIAGQRMPPSSALTWPTPTRHRHREDQHQPPDRSAQGQPDHDRQLEEEFARLRTSNDARPPGFGLNSSVSDLTNRLDVTERERRILAEQLTQTQGEAQRLGQIIKGAGSAPSAGVGRQPLWPANINGVIKDVRAIAGNSTRRSPSLGRSRRRGMEFKVLDRATATSWDAGGRFCRAQRIHGRLFGPRIAEIRRA